MQVDELEDSEAYSSSSPSSSSTIGCLNAGPPRPGGSCLLPPPPDLLSLGSGEGSALGIGEDFPGALPALEGAKPGLRLLLLWARLPALDRFELRGGGDKVNGASKIFVPNPKLEDDAEVGS